MQRLFKEHGLNPAQQMGGCLILFLQLPIWYALYSTLQYALGLRQAGFLYIEDLTRADQLFHIGLHLPWLGDFFEWFNLLPILYVILTVVNQSLQPKPDDPQMRAQFRMMTFMLVFFGFIFYNFPAGFMLYIMTSSALGIIESKIIKAELRREEGEPGNTVKGSAGGPQSGSNSGGSMYPARTKKSEDASPRVQEPFRTRRKR
jgi:YidC/Oxa1 family membrane protein insertase